MDVLGDTGEFQHPDFTDQEVSALRVALTMALERVDNAYMLATSSGNPSVVAHRGNITMIRGALNSIVSGLR
jgi:hypothetical protein